MTKRIGILTGGGDVPGLNACIRAVVENATENGWEVIGFRRGWAGPLSISFEDFNNSCQQHVIPLNRTAVRTIDRTGGTILHTSRTDPVHLTRQNLEQFPDLRGAAAGDAFDATDHVLGVIDKLGLDAMVTLGGDGTLRFTAHLHDQGVPVIAIPKTMDNDVFGTDYCIGFSTAVTRSVDAITALRTTVSSHERVGIIELFGRRSGETALFSGLLAQADRTVISEVPVDMTRLSDLITQDRAASPNHYAMLVVSEGAHIEGETSAEEISVSAAERQQLGIGRRIGDYLRRHHGVGVVIQELAYLMRAGAPDALDRMVALSYGTMAVQLLSENRSGLMTALVDGNYAVVPAGTVREGCKMVDIGALYDIEQYRPKISKILGRPMLLG